MSMSKLYILDMGRFELFWRFATRQLGILLS